MHPAKLLLSLPLMVSPLYGADSIHQYDAVRGLGAVNGLALYCKSFDQVRRMKEAVVANAPKERSFGLAFDESTDEAFRSAIAKQLPCPGAAGFADQVGAAVEALRQAFGRP